MSNDRILRQIDAYLAKTGMAETTLGRKALNDGKAIKQLRQGRRMWPETLTRLREFLSSANNSRAA